MNELPALGTGQASTDSRAVVSQSPHPTSVEFESVFRDLLDEALDPEDRNLLIVVDNLDRVEPSDALSIWSTLQTFLGHKEYQRPDWIDRLWILIPYDDKAILRLWDGSGPSANSKLVTSFLDKTFQLRFRVPPLLLSNWREFLKEALQQAFPDHLEEDYHGVFRAFATKGGPDTSAPTPRDLKTLVNQVGALHGNGKTSFHSPTLLAMYSFRGIARMCARSFSLVTTSSFSVGLLDRIGEESSRRFILENRSRWHVSFS